MSKVLMFLIALLPMSLYADEVAAPLIDLGEKVTFDGTQQEVYIRLPKSYHTSKRSYPVIYLLDADLFYMKNIFFHSVALIDRLTQAGQTGDIPEAIVVGIPFGTQKQWYNQTQSEPKALRQFISKTLPQKLKHQYRVLDYSLLVGQSYSGAFVIDLLAHNANSFDTVLAIDAIFPDSQKLAQTIQNLGKLNGAQSVLLSAQSEAPSLDVEQVINALPKSKHSGTTQQVYPNESHLSVYYAALNDGLRHHFKDYRAPAKSLLKKQTFDDKAIKDYFAKANKKYQRTMSPEQLASAANSVAYFYLKQKRFDVAFVLYDQYATQRYYKYILNRFAEQSYNQQDYRSATLLWQKMANRFGDSPETRQGLTKTAKHPH